MITTRSQTREPMTVHQALPVPKTWSMATAARATLSAIWCRYTEIGPTLVQLSLMSDDLQTAAHRSAMPSGDLVTGCARDHGRREAGPTGRCGLPAQRGGELGGGRGGRPGSGDEDHRRRLLPHGPRVAGANRPRRDRQVGAGDCGDDRMVSRRGQDPKNWSRRRRRRTTTSPRRWRPRPCGRVRPSVATEVLLAPAPPGVLAPPVLLPAVLGAPCSPPGEQSETGLDHVRVSAGELVQEQLPLAAVEGFEARLDGQFLTSPTRRGSHWFPAGGQARGPRHRPAAVVSGPGGVARQVAGHLGLSNLGSHGQLISRWCGNRGPLWCPAIGPTHPM